MAYRWVAKAEPLAWLADAACGAWDDAVRGDPRWLGALVQSGALTHVTGPRARKCVGPGPQVLVDRRTGPRARAPGPPTSAGIGPDGTDQHCTPTRSAPKDFFGPGDFSMYSDGCDALLGPMSVADTPEWLSTRDACDRLGVTLRTLYRLIDEQRLPCFQFGRVYRLRTADIDTLVANAKEKVTLVPRSAAAAVFAVDVLADEPVWSRLTADGTHSSSGSLDALVDTITDDLAQARPVALGFCSPLSIPLPPTTLGLTRPRYGDESPGWATGPGAERLVVGLQAATWVLAAVCERVNRTLDVGVDPAAFVDRQLDLMVWEAIPADGAGPIDVGRAAREASRRLIACTFGSDVNEPVCISLAGTALAAVRLTKAAAMVSAAPWVVAVKSRPIR